MKDITFLACTAAFLLASIFGYGNNIYKVFASPNFETQEMVRIAGIVVAPVGVVMGYVDDTNNEI
jgi:hypothetical protein